MKQEIRFCTAADGVRIAYATVGSGPPLVKAANYLTHLEHDWNGPTWRHWLRALAENHTLVRYDERGCGLSDRDAPEDSLDAWVRDLEAVVEAAKLERFPLLGISQGASASLFPELTPREFEILVLLAQGASNERIADELAIAPKTVRNHVSNIYSKLSLTTRAEAIVLAREAGRVRMPSLPAGPHL